jgi:hypothetical protein
MRGVDAVLMSTTRPATPHDETESLGNGDRVVPATRRRAAAGTKHSACSEVDRLRAQLAGMPDERWTKA